MKIFRNESEWKLTCLKLTMETPENMWNLFKVNNKDNGTASNAPTVDFDKVNVCWVMNRVVACHESRFNASNFSYIVVSIFGIKGQELVLLNSSSSFGKP